MRFAQANDSGGFLIEAYGPEGIRVAGRLLAGPLAVTPNRLIEPWGPWDIAGLESSHLESLLALAPEVIVLGTGQLQRFPEAALLALVLGRGVGIEVMDTGAACRTYNILMAEGRRVAAALLPMGERSTARDL